MKHGLSRGVLPSFAGRFVACRSAAMSAQLAEMCDFPFQVSLETVAAEYLDVVEQAEGEAAYAGVAAHVEAQQVAAAVVVGDEGLGLGVFLLHDVV